MANKRIVNRGVKKTVSNLLSARRKKSKGKSFLLNGLAIVLIGLACVLPGILTDILGSALIACGIVLVYVAILIIVYILYSKKKYKEFMAIDNVMDYVDVEQVSDMSRFGLFCESDCIIFGSKKDEIMPFIYNWFVSARIINRNERLKIYAFKASLVKSFYVRLKTGRTLEDDNELIVLNLDEIIEDDIDENVLNEFVMERNRVIRPFAFASWVETMFDIPQIQNNADDEYDEYDVDEDDNNEEADVEEENEDFVNEVVDNDAKQ